MEMDTREVSEKALQGMRARGFDDAYVSASSSSQNELTIAHNEPSLLRSTQGHNLSLLGLLDGRQASTQLSDTSEAAVAAAIDTLYDGAQAAPQDEANAVSSGQMVELQHGPQQCDASVLAEKAAEILEFRALNTPSMNIDEGLSAHTHLVSHTVTSGGSALSSRIGFYSMMVMGTAKEGKKSSSFNYTGGNSYELGAHACDLFGIGSMLRDTERQIHTQCISAPFNGSVVLAPGAVVDLVDWLRSQVTDYHLIAGSSLYRDKVGAEIASPLLSVRGLCDAPGVCAVSADGFSVPELSLVDQGKLVALLPSLYGSRKTGLPHVASLASGWSIDPGSTTLDDLLATVERGALVGRLAMGSPAANGDFSGVIKNSFLIEEGVTGPALQEVMVTGNVARMLRDIIDISSERIDAGDSCYPWLHIANLHFS